MAIPVLRSFTALLSGLREFYSKHRPARFLLFGSIIFNISLWAILWLGVPAGSDIILHYNIYFGVDSIGNQWQTLFSPAWGLVILLVNNLIAGIVSRDNISKYFLLGLAAFIQLILLIAGVATVIINRV
ncbi:hypothetical protein CL634_07605 [bacterium]|nr:hypothetical protein [bacterium]|tara:strand:- start:620 stop:1006 length:387 start_codon:yes stop_codon:yes gene_type:complete